MPLKVLLADDSMTAQNMGKKILSEAGYQVIAVSNGAQAMKKLASEKPDLVVLDVYMPGYSGLEVCERIKSTPESANTPVILCVAKMEPFRQEEGKRVKADAVIIKPFEATDLVARMQEMQDKLARWRASRVDVEESVSRFEPPEPEPVEEEPARNRLEVPQEMAATPAFGMDLEAESAAAAANFTGELVVEHEREPVDIGAGSHLVSADGLSGVFEMQQPAPVQSEVQEFSIAAPVIEREPELETSSDVHTEAEQPSIAPNPAIERFDAEAPNAADAAPTTDFEIAAPPAVEDSAGGPFKPDSGLSGEVHEDPKLSVEDEAAAAGEVEPRPEFVVDHVSVSLSDAPADMPELPPLPPDPVENLEPAVEVEQTPIIIEPAAEMQVESSSAIAVAAEEEKTFEDSANWVAEEVALDPGENLVSIEEEIKALLPQASEEAAPVNLEIDESDEQAADASSVSAQGEPAPAPEPPPGAVEQAMSTSEVLSSDVQWPSADSLRCESEPVIEATLEAETTAPPEVTHATDADHQLATAMAAAITANVASAEPSAPVDPNLVEQAVDRLLDRLKPDLVSQILRELNKK